MLLVLGVNLIMCALPHPSYSQGIEASQKWREIELSFGSFSAPPDLVSEEVNGRDSAVWRFKSESLILGIDLGLYSGKPSIDREENNYVEKSAVINKKKATIVSFKFSDLNPQEFKYVTAVYFPKVDSDATKLSFVAHCKTPKEQKLAEKIFRSIKFKKKELGSKKELEKKNWGHL